MLTQDQKDRFEGTGYLVVPDVLGGRLLTDIQEEAERVLFRRAAFRKILEVSRRGEPGLDFT